MKKILLFTVLLLHTTLSVYAQATITIGSVKNEYHLGDLIEVHMDIESISSFNNIHFDFEYDEDTLDWVEYRKTSLTEDSDLQFAKGISRDGKKGLVIFSANWDENINIHKKNNFLTLVFRVKNSSKSSSFLIKNRQIKSFDNTVLEANWPDDIKFNVSDSNGSYIMIKKPHDGIVTSENSADISLIFTKNRNYSVEVKNDSNNFTSGILDAPLGYKEDVNVILSEGKNLITAHLLDENNTVVAIDSSTINLKNEDNALRILSPDQSSVVNQNKILVKVASKFSDVTINEVSADDLGYMDENQQVFSKSVWLRPGFNTIYIKAESADKEEVYKKELQVYFDKSDEVFRIISPLNSEIIKYETGISLTFTGEISQKFSTNSKENVVTYDAIFYPRDYRSAPKEVVKNKLAKITESSSISDLTEAAYIFSNVDPIPLTGYKSGTLEIIAYKNKIGSTFEESASSYVVIDNSKLEILLDQPRVYSADTLINEKTINEFHSFSSSTEAKKFYNVELNPTGEFYLEDTDRSITSSNPWNNPRKGLMELKDGTMLYYANKNNIAKFQQKKLGSSEWTNFLESNKFHIYDAVETNKGLLLGVSNYTLDGNTGLYLLDKGKLTNVVIGKPITHVQFIRKLGDTIFVYGNDYSHIYSFNLNTLEPENGKYVTSVVDSYSLSNSLAIRDFQISDTLNNVAILTDNGDLSFYTLENNSYVKNDFVKSNRYNNVDYILYGNYEKSDYNCWLISSGNVIDTVMESKATGNLKEFEVKDGITHESIKRISFYNDDYYIFSVEGTENKISKGKFFFNRFVEDNKHSYHFTTPIPTANIDSDLIITEYNGFYWGDGAINPIYNFTSNIRSDGYAKFSYKNPDVEGIRGFSFTVPGKWIDTESFTFDFKNSGTNSFNSQGFSNQAKELTIKKWIEKYQNHNNWESFISYNSSSKKYLIDIDFKDLEKDTDLDFIFRFKASGSASPVLSNINVKKKVPVKIPTTDTSFVRLPIKGRVTDPTVTSVLIEGEKVILDGTGAFNKDLSIDTSRDKDTINLECINSTGEYTKESFEIHLFKSINGLVDTEFFIEATGTAPVVFDADNEKVSNNDTIYVSSNYYGLKGLIIGYELLSFDEKTVIKQGLFETVKDSVFNVSIYSGVNNNLESGKICHQPIKLIPGSQKVRIFVENPGGKRDLYYLTEDKLPVFVYNMPEDLERIKLISSKVVDVALDRGETYEVFEDINVLQEYNITVPETKLPPYRFVKKVQLAGNIESLQSLSHVKIRSSSEDITFSNGLQEIVVDVDEINNFRFELDVNMKEGSPLKEDHYLIFQPTAPYLIRLKSVVKLKLLKDFKGAYIIPDFTYMLDDNVLNPIHKWSDKERNSASKEILVKYERNLPVGARMRLVVNFNNEIDGLLSLVPGKTDTYQLLDKDGFPLNLEGVKFGINRVRWDLYYGMDNSVISSSTMSHPDMRDFVFNLFGESTFIDTVIDFPYEAGTYYKEKNIPKITYVKDVSTTLTVLLNDRVYKTVEANDEAVEKEIILKPEDLLQGKNDIEILSETPSKGSVKTEYTLLYDTEKPKIGRRVISIDIDNSIKSISTIVKETNIKSVKLYDKYYPDKEDGTESISPENLINLEPEITPLSRTYHKVEWNNLDLLEPKLNPRKTLKRLMISVEDYAGGKSTEEYFLGPKILEESGTGELSVIKPSNIQGANDRYYEGNPSADYRPVYSDTRSRWVFYDNDPIITNLDSINRYSEGADLTKDFIIERSGDIKFEGVKLKENFTGNLVINSGTGSRVTFSNNFSFPLGKKLKINVNNGIRKAPQVKEILKKKLYNFSLCFNMDIEESPAFKEHTITLAGEKQQVIKRIFTYGSHDGTDLYLGYTRSANKNNIDFVLVLGNRIEKFTDFKDITPGSYTILTNLSTEKNLQSFVLNIDNRAQSINLRNHGSLDYMLEKDSEMFFGEKDGQNNGHFAVSQAFYADRLFGTSDISNYTKDLEKHFPNYTEPAKIADNTYDFKLSKSDKAVPIKTGSETYELRIGNGRFTTKEDVGYALDGTNFYEGALIGSKYHRNFLEIKNGFIVFNDCDIPVRSNSINAKMVGNFLEIDVDADKRGRYTFGNKPTNHGLNNDKFFSISGSVSRVKPSDDPEIDAELVLIYNNKETRYPLREGDFQFVYDNSSHEVPDSVVLYIETAEDIRIKDDLQFVEGNYKLEDDVLFKNTSYVSTKYHYEKTGSVELYFKPFNTNVFGQVDYEGVILDSDLVDIYTTYNVDKVCYAAKVGNVPLVSNIPVMDGWHHLMVTYNNRYKQVRFYIDGEIAAYSEGEFTFPASGINTTLTDNVFIGGDPLTQKFANGYIDEVAFTTFCLTPFNTNMGKPIQISYSEDSEPVIDINKSNSGLAKWNTNIYSILSKNRNNAPIVESFTDSLENNRHKLSSNVKPGLYFARLEGELNNKRVSSQIQFVRDDKPLFDLIKIPKLIISNVKKELAFSFVFDNSYLPENKTARYAGLALKIKGKDSNREEIVYLCQDYLSQNSNLWLYKYKDDLYWEPIIKEKNIFNLIFKDQQWAEDVLYGYATFYFNGSFENIDLTNLDFNIKEKEDFIPVASLRDVKKVYELFTDVNGNELQYEYMLDLSLAGAVKDTKFDNIDNFKVKYSVKNNNNSAVVTFKHDGFMKLYYDDILNGLPYGTYDINLELIYKGSSFQSKSVTVNWAKVDPGVIVVEKKHSLEIGALELLFTRKENNINYGNFYFSYNYSNSDSPNISIKYVVKTFDVTDGKNDLMNIREETLATPDYVIIEDVLLSSGLTRVEVEILEKINEKNIVTNGISDDTFTVVNTRAEAPEIVLTNTVDSYISFDSMTFTWKGLVSGKPNDAIEYKYNFDRQGWSTASREWKQLELYGLKEGRHELKVKAIYQDQESTEAISRFFVDVKHPTVKTDLIEVEKLYDDDGIPYEVRFKGLKGSVMDVSLDYFRINGTNISVNAEGEFQSLAFPIPKEGENIYYLEAIDKVGNLTAAEITVDNSFIEILSPAGKTVKYAPLTLVGKLSDKINQNVKVFLQDSLRKDIWIPGRINSDRIFFIDDIGINPGSSYKKAKTDLKLKFEFDSGVVFYKDIQLEAGTLYRPLTVELSKQATQGAGEPIEVSIEASCAIEDIASWSIDYDGDGIYDDIRVTYTSLENRHIWKHSYSTIGEVTPKIRVITRNGEYFTQAASLIIHEEVKSASSTTIIKPIAMSIAHMQDKSEKVFVLNGESNAAKVDVFLVGRNLNYFSNRQFSLELKDLVEGSATNILAIDDTSFLISTEKGNDGILYLFSQNEFGNYEVKDSRFVGSYIASMALSDNYFFYTQKTNSQITRYKRVNNLVDMTSYEKFNLKLPLGENVLPYGTPITVLNGTLYAADNNDQRIIEYSENIVPLDYWGEYGHNDKEFIQPNILAGYGHRLFVSDSSKENIQIFDSSNKLVSSLNNSGGYLENNFFTELVSIDSLGREEGGRLFYYIVALSKSAESLSLIRLPQWEEMRARTRNNKIVFLKDREVYTAKPDGSDLRKVLSTDSLPRIDGVVDYPTLSPDGRRLTFVSRKRIYTGANEKIVDETWAYDNLYIFTIGDERPVKVPLNGLDSYEIERPVFNSNGDSIAFSARTDGGFWQVYEYNWNTGIVTKLFESIENLRFPYYSPDDRYLVYTTDYDGDQDLEIFDKENPDIRIEVTNNDFRDSFPVWTRIYPFELSNPDLDIESKIAFVSDRGFKKGIHYAYISKPSDNDIRIVTDGGKDVGDDPDTAAIEITKGDNEGDYPAFTGDGKHVVYEEYDGISQTIVKWDHDSDTSEVMNLPEGSQKPSGMRNTIAGFKADIQNGNEVKLSWTPYTDHKTFYQLQYQKEVESDNFTQKKIYSQDGTVISGLEMNTNYLMRVLIEENEQEVATTRWLKVEVPEVVARPSYEIDPENPYLVKLHAWKPEKDTEWKFIWIIDNQEISTANTSQDIHYEFGTSGEKTIQLKATNREGTYTSISEPIRINIVTDIEPVIESVLITGSTNYLELDAENSLGNKINMSSALWTVTGPGVEIPKTFTGSKAIVDVSDFTHKVNVNLKLSRHMVQGQQETDTIEINNVIDLDYTEVKPIITYGSAEDNERLITFDGTRSLGNIDWRTARWAVFSDGNLIHREDGVSSFSYLFAETSKPVPYAVSLTVGDVGTGLTKTSSQSIDVDPAPMEPVIEYEVLTLKNQAGNDKGVKVILSATSSKGSNIDFNLTEWNLPLAAQFGEQPKQKGPTAIFNLTEPGQLTQVEVSITLLRRGGTDAVTKTTLINIDGTGVSETEIFVNKEITETTEGYVITLDVLDSVGSDIDWKSTEWLLNGQYSFKGPVARVDKSYMGEEQDFDYTVVLHRFGSDPITQSGNVPLNPYEIRPNIKKEFKDNKTNTLSLTVKHTEGLNIDWSRTLWSIYDGNEDVVQKRGATILHTFVPKSKTMGYPVMVEMYLKNDDTPFYGYKSIDIEGDELHPIIQWDQDISGIGEEADSRVITFSALSSTGSGIDWSQTKWNFGDGSAPAYGSTVQHKYPSDGVDRSYKVALTLVRKNRNGSNENRTVYKNIDIGAEEITPVITARIDLDSNTLILSAEASEGRGILLDRSVWMFAGKGDTENFSRSKSSVETKNNSESSSNSHTDSESESDTTSHTGHGSLSVSVQKPVPKIAEVTATGGYSQTNSDTSGSSSSDTTGSSSSESSGTSDTQNNNHSFSTQNTHTGAVCRRFVEDFDFSSYEGGTNDSSQIWVTLFVYRVNSDGGMSGTTITERINLEEVGKAGTKGKEYR